MIDAKSELDGRLRTAINEHVNEYVWKMTSEISTIASTDTADTAIEQQQQQFNHNGNTQRNKQEKLMGKKMPTIFRPTAIAALKSSRTAVQHNVPILKRKLGEYIDNERTREMLLAAVLEGVLGKYEKFWERVEGVGFDGNNGISSRDRTHNYNRKSDYDDDENVLWSPETFSQWCISVFGIGRIGRSNATATATTATAAATAAAQGKEMKDENQNTNKTQTASQASGHGSANGTSSEEGEGDSRTENENDEQVSGNSEDMLAS